MVLAKNEGEEFGQRIIAAFELLSFVGSIPGVEFTAEHSHIVGTIKDYDLEHLLVATCQGLREGDASERAIVYGRGKDTQILEHTEFIDLAQLVLGLTETTEVGSDR